MKPVEKDIISCVCKRWRLAHCREKTGDSAEHLWLFGVVPVL